MALATRLGRQDAYRLVQAACQRALGSGIDLRQAALEDDEIRVALPPEAIAQALEPVRYLGSTDTFIRRALGRFEKLRRAAEA
jgi:3-carboxy-cis,cis-muconate cycloisomerase